MNLGSKRRRRTVNGCPPCPTAPTTWTQCLVPPPSTEIEWDVTRKGPFHYGEMSNEFDEFSLFFLAFRPCLLALKHTLTFKSVGCVGIFKKLDIFQEITFIKKGYVEFIKICISQWYCILILSCTTFFNIIRNAPNQHIKNEWSCDTED